MKNLLYSIFLIGFPILLFIIYLFPSTNHYPLILGYKKLITGDGLNFLPVLFLNDPTRGRKIDTLFIKNIDPSPRKTFPDDMGVTFSHKYPDHRDAVMVRRI